MFIKLKKKEKKTVSNCFVDFLTHGRLVPSLSRFIPELLVDSYPSQQTPEVCLHLTSLIKTG